VVRGDDDAHAIEDVIFADVLLVDAYRVGRRHAEIFDPFIEVETGATQGSRQGM
jgi:hypothetical protein